MRAFLSYCTITAFLIAFCLFVKPSKDWTVVMIAALLAVAGTFMYRVIRSK